MSRLISDLNEVQQQQQVMLITSSPNHLLLNLSLSLSYCGRKFDIMDQQRYLDTYLFYGIQNLSKIFHQKNEKPCQ